MLEGFGLTKDPFAIVPEAPVENWAGYPDLKEDLLDLVLGVRARDIGSSEFVVLHGELGAGKSHALRYLATEIERVDGEFKSLVIYVERPRVAAKFSFLALYRYIIAEIGRDLLADVCKSMAARLNRLVEKAAEDAGYRDEPNKESFERRVISKLRRGDRSMTQLLSRGAKEPEDVIRFLMGDGKCNGAEYDGKIDSDFVAARVLGDLFRVVTSTIDGSERILESVYIFIDECEILFDGRATDSDPVFSGFRELINGVPYGLGLFLSFSAAAALIEAYMPQHLLKRMTHGFVEVPMLEEDEAVDFVTEQLRSFRVEGWEGTNELYPFTCGAVAYIASHQTILTPRNLFKDCRRVLERAVRRHELDVGQEIGEELAGKILRY